MDNSTYSWSIVNKVINHQIGLEFLETIFENTVKMIVDQPFLLKTMWTLVDYVRLEYKDMEVFKTHHMMGIVGTDFEWGYHITPTCVSGVIRLMDKEYNLSLIFIPK